MLKMKGKKFLIESTQNGMHEAKKNPRHHLPVINVIILNIKGNSGSSQACKRNLVFNQETQNPHFFQV